MKKIINIISLKRDDKMKFIKSAYPSSENFNPTTDVWTKSKEPTQKVFFILAFIILVFTILIMHKLRDFLSPSNSYTNILYDMIFFLVLIPIHELLHALVFPEPLTSRNVIFGTLLEKGCFYAYYDGEMTKCRFLISIITPFTILTLIPLILVIFGVFNSYLFEFSYINSLFCCGDIISFFIIIFTLPQKSIVRNKGWYTYYRM